MIHFSWNEWNEEVLVLKIMGMDNIQFHSIQNKNEEMCKQQKIICFIPNLFHFYLLLQILFIIYNMLDTLTFLNHRFDFSWERKRSPVNKSKVSMRMYDKLILISVHQNIVARTNITFNPVPTFVFSTILSQEISKTLYGYPYQEFL